MALSEKIVRQIHIIRRMGLKVAVPQELQEISFKQYYSADTTTTTATEHIHVSDVISALLGEIEIEKAKARDIKQALKILFEIKRETDNGG
jgi:hypothetical protein